MALILVFNSRRTNIVTSIKLKITTIYFGAITSSGGWHIKYESIPLVTLILTWLFRILLWMNSIRSFGKSFIKNSHSMDLSLLTNIFMPWMLIRLRFQTKLGTMMTMVFRLNHNISLTKPLGVSEVCKLEVNLGKMPHKVVKGRLGASPKLYKQFEYFLRVSFENNGVLGFVLESSDATPIEYGRQAATFSTVG